MEELVCAIIAQAVEDWRKLIKKKCECFTCYDRRISFDEIRTFFKSDYCELLCAGTKLNPAAILEQLEREKRNAYKR